MAETSDTGAPEHPEAGITWTGEGVTRGSTGALHVPLRHTDTDGHQTPLSLTLTPDQSALLFAQFHRLLTAGWALSDEEQFKRQEGETYPRAGF